MGWMADARRRVSGPHSLRPMCLTTPELQERRELVREEHHRRMREGTLLNKFFHCTDNVFHWDLAIEAMTAGPNVSMPLVLRDA